MKRFVMVLAASLVLAACSLGADTPDPPPVVGWEEFMALTRRVEVLERAAGIREVPTVAAPRTSSTVIPPGHHAHTRTDGTTLVHADSSRGDPAAHAGVAWPWVVTGLPGQTVQSSLPSGEATATRSEVFEYRIQSRSQSCPGGVCPAPSSSREFRPFGGLFRR